jgi:actin-related protein
MRSDCNIRRDLFSNIILSGGSTQFEGMQQRLVKEINLLAPPDNKIQVIAPQDRIYSVWIGGSILTQLSTFNNMWISKSDYEEGGGLYLLERKCF